MRPHLSNIVYFNKPDGAVRRFRLFITPFFVLALLFWLLNPYACCPADAPSAMPMTDNPAEALQPVKVGNSVDLVQGKSLSQSTVDAVPKGTPRSLPEPTPNLPSPILSFPVRAALVTAVFNPNEAPLSEIILPSVPPPRG